jgi:hypothetical protein
LWFNYSKDALSVDVILAKYYLAASGIFTERAAKVMQGAALPRTSGSLQSGKIACFSSGTEQEATVFWVEISRK